MRALIVLGIAAAAVALPPASYKGEAGSETKPPEIEEKRPPPTTESDDLEHTTTTTTKLPPIEPRATSQIPPIEPRTTLTCGTHALTAGSYKIQSINHPQNYVNNHDCDYTLSVAGDGGSIAFSCSAFNLEYNSRCGWDWVNFNNVKYCGSTPPAAGTYSQISFRFHTDYSVVRSGFSCELSVTGGSSGGSELSCASHTLDRGNYFIKSPNHPANYGNNFDCTYSLTTATASDTIAISCSAFNIEQNNVCRWDWLRVNSQKYCGSTAPSTTSTGSMSIDFHADYSVVRSGYLCQIEVSEGNGGGGSGSCCCGTPNRASRIVGGQETEVNEYPWQVGLVRSGGSSTFCGGSVINSKYVLTAAHCTSGSSASSIELLVREHNTAAADGEVRVGVAAIIQHPSYTSATSSGYDFALLRLATELQFASDNRIAPVCLPTDATNMYVGSNATVTGWGTLSSGGALPNTLQEVTVPVISNTACKSAYGNNINPSMVCAGVAAGGLDSCQGDSGGPLITLETDRYNLIGVVSWGRGCALPDYPGVYARVTSVLPWILSNSNDGTTCS